MRRAVKSEGKLNAREIMEGKEMRTNSTRRRGRQSKRGECEERVRKKGGKLTKKERNEIDENEDNKERKRNKI